MSARDDQKDRAKAFGATAVLIALAVAGALFMAYTTKRTEGVSERYGGPMAEPRSAVPSTEARDEAQ